MSLNINPEFYTSEVNVYYVQIHMYIYSVIPSTTGIRYRYMMVTLNTTLVIIGKMEAEKFTVYCNTELEPAATKRVAKALVDCKVCIYIHMAKLH